MEQFSYPSPERYLAALAAERHVYENRSEVHNLPPIFHYWSNKYLRPQLEALGYAGIPELFAFQLAKQCSAKARFASIGAGNCDFEIDLARRLNAAGHDNFTIECIDINPSMLRRGTEAAKAAGVGHHLRFTQADFNTWKPTDRYGTVMANQSLHHVVRLEHLFEQVHSALQAGGVFLVSDMVGRNGHVRWPEAFAITTQLWRQLPPSRRVNRVQGLYQEAFEDIDCSSEGFEGVRAQDILPLLLERFHFHFFFPYGNTIDTFVDRLFGPNFNPDLSCDRDFIDMVHAVDEAGLQSGHLTPTHLIAVLAKEPCAAPFRRQGMVPEDCVRDPDEPPAIGAPAIPEAHFPESAEEELRLFTTRMAQGRETIRARMEWALRTEASIAQCEKWVQDVEADRGAQLAHMEALRTEFEERSRWALRLHADLEEKTAALARLQKEFDERTAWALRLTEDAAEDAAEILRLRSELEAAFPVAGA